MATLKGDDEGEEMVPSSEGWPPPWGWKMVFSVTTAKSPSVPCLNRARLASSRAENGQMADMTVWRVWSLALWWKARYVRAATVLPCGGGCVS